MVLQRLPMLPQKDRQSIAGLQHGSRDKAAAKRELRKGLVSTLTLQTFIFKAF